MVNWNSCPRRGTFADKNATRKKIGLLLKYTKIFRAYGANLSGDILPADPPSFSFFRKTRGVSWGSGSPGYEILRFRCQNFSPAAQNDPQFPFRNHQMTSYMVQNFPPAAQNEPQFPSRNHQMTSPIFKNFRLRRKMNLNFPLEIAKWPPLYGSKIFRLRRKILNLNFPLEIAKWDSPIFKFFAPAAENLASISWVISRWELMIFRRRRPKILAGSGEGHFTYQMTSPDLPGWPPSQMTSLPDDLPRWPPCQMTSPKWPPCQMTSPDDLRKTRGGQLEVYLLIQFTCSITISVLFRYEISVYFSTIMENFGLLFQHGTISVYFFGMKKSQFTFSTMNFGLLFRHEIAVSLLLYIISVYFFDMENFTVYFSTWRISVYFFHTWEISVYFSTWRISVYFFYMGNFSLLFRYDENFSLLFLHGKFQFTFSTWEISVYFFDMGNFSLLFRYARNLLFLHEEFRFTFFGYFSIISQFVNYSNLGHFCQQNYTPSRKSKPKFSIQKK